MNTGKWGIINMRGGPKDVGEALSRSSAGRPDSPLLPHRLGALSTVSGITGYQTHVINSWSYAAALFTWIYFLGMRAWGQAVLAFVIFAIAGVIVAENPGVWIAWAAPFIFSFVCGWYGKRVAWHSRQWQDFEDFLACQRLWTKFSVCATLIVFSLLMIHVAGPSWDLRVAKEV